MSVRELLNVLYVMRQGAVLHLEHDTIRVEVEDEADIRIPLLRVAGIVVFGRVSLTPFLIHRCAEDGRSVAWFRLNGHFGGRLEGRARGNVLVRRAQHLALSDTQRTWRIARQVVAAKVQNARQVLLRAARETHANEDTAALALAGARLADMLVRLRDTTGLDPIRGIEGEAAREYFAVFGRMVRSDGDAFSFGGRTRRPPRDRMNALLSFMYALLRSECAAAAEGVGLDPQVGFLHALRPGRPALALDLLEELRAPIADRIALTLINRRQLREEHFEETLGGGIQLTEQGRRAILAGYQERKEEEIEHRVLDRKVPLGLVPHVQARLLARHLRGDIEDYPPFLYR